MELDSNVGGADRLVRVLLTVALSIVAVDRLRSGNRSIALLAAVGAIGLGFNATTCFCGLNRALGIDTSE
jgi:hypothetical protein